MLQKKTLDLDNFIGMFYQTDKTDNLKFTQFGARELFLLGQPNLDCKQDRDSITGQFYS